MAAVAFIVRFRVAAGREDEFLARYDALRRRVGQGLAGHIEHRLCRDRDDPAQWAIASHWESYEASQAWERSDEHRELIQAMRACWDETQRTSYDVLIETEHP
jgi:heme-degrading monooxygenase HmoA